MSDRTIVSDDSYLNSTTTSEVMGMDFLHSADWSKTCVHDESTLHQLSPYIGKMKSSIASSLIQQFSVKEDLVLDPFAGSFTVPLQAALMGRDTVGVDISPYATMLGHGKLFPPDSLELAIEQARWLLVESQARPSPDLRSVPLWVRQFFHPQTLKEVLRFADTCAEHGAHFHMACLLGILHHQRPGFLSYPSSHLVPYLRDKKFPIDEYPELYAYRPLEPRLISKIERVYKRFENVTAVKRRVVSSSIETFRFPSDTGCIITSPPYMNALDYGRDNRLRLWFLNRTEPQQVDPQGANKRDHFALLMKKLATGAGKCLRPEGYCIIVIGEQSNRTYRGSPSQFTQEVFETHAPQLKLIRTAVDDIPDIRRARRNCRGVRVEHFLVFKKV